MRPAILLALVACSSGSESKPPPSAPLVRFVGCQLAPPPMRPMPALDPPTPGAVGHGIDPALRERHLGAPQVRVGPPLVTGSLDRGIVRRLLRATHYKLSLCYQLVLADNPEAAGTADAKFSIAGTGKVPTANVSGFDAHLTSCISDVITKIEFPKSPDGLAVQVEVQFAFKRASDAAFPWTPYALRGRDDDPATRDRVSAEIERVHADIDACFGSAKGALRAVIAPAQTLRVRAGGLGDPRVEDCVANALRAIQVSPSSIELACDFEAGGPAPWRISPTGYERISPGASIDEPPKPDASYLIVAGRDTPGDKIDELATWASPAAIVAVAVTSDSGAPIFVGLAPSAQLPVESAPSLGLAAKAGSIATCDGKDAAKIADPHALDARFATLHTPVAFALTPDITAKELVGLSSAATRAKLPYRLGGACP
jgi:hypothetical protein